MITPEFKEAYEKLNPEQKTAVDTIEGPVMVVAGPGTGKTQVLTLRIANILLKTDTRPENILALTFTEAAATNMRKRLQKIIGSTAHRVQITTFHSFCNDVIQRYPEYFPRIAGARNLTQVQATEIVEQVVLGADLKILRPWGDPALYVGDIIRRIEELKREGLSPEEFEEVVNKAQKNIESRDDLYHQKGAYKGRMKGEFADELRKIEKNKELALVYKEYQRTLFEKRFYDYSDMIVEVLKVLKAASQKPEAEELKHILQENHQYILVDEHQDTNQAQNKILEIICDFHSEPNIFVVGDVKQAIFRFQGASIENFLYFKNKYPNAKLIELFRNYRSTQEILDSAFSLTAESLELKAEGKAKGENIKIASFKNETIENYWVASQIKNMAGDTAVIYRTNKDAFAMSLVLKKLGIKHVIESDEDLMSEKYVVKLVAILYAVNFLGNDDYIVEALHLEEFGIDPIDSYKLLRRASQERKSIFEVETEGRHKQIFDLFRHWSKAAHEEEVTMLLEKILSESGILDSMIASKDAEAFLGIERFFDEAKTFSLNNGGAKLNQFVNYLDIIKSHKIFIRRPRTGNGECQVRLMTAHRAKGLEFDNVFIIGASDRSFGPKARRERLPLIEAVYELDPSSSKEDFDEASDERRLFYVALTRAKKNLFITYSESDLEGREALPSPFIQEIRDDRKQIIDTDKFQKEIEEDRSVLYAESKLKNLREVDKEFVNELWQSHILSVTALNNYLECPWKYFYRNLLRIPEVQEKYLIYGSCMHGAVDDMFRAYRQAGKTDKGHLLDSFERHLMNSVLSKKEKEEALARGKEALSIWFDERSSSWQHLVMTEFPIKCVEVEGVQIGGKLDKVEIVKGSDVIVTDYKTGRAKSRNEIEGNLPAGRQGTKDSNGDIKRQLVFYQLLLNLWNDGQYKMQKGIIEFLEPTLSTSSGQAGKIKVEEFEITPDEVEELKETIKRVADEITNLKFWDKTCGEKDCKWCGYRKLV